MNASKRLRDTIRPVNLREAITHELEKLGEGDLKLVLAFVSALASPDRQAKMSELLRRLQELGEMADPVTQRAIEALRTARAIAKMHGIPTKMCWRRFGHIEPANQS